jgi:hypothetical protein
MVPKIETEGPSGITAKVKKAVVAAITGAIM